MPIPGDQLPVGPGLRPDGTGEASFFIDKNELSLVEKDGPEWKLEDAKFILEAIREPDAIFQGLNRPGHSESYAYSVRPSRDPASEESDPIPPRFGYAFVAFARSGWGGFIVFDWEWREEDGDHPGHPIRWETDFENRTWHRT